VLYEGGQRDAPITRRSITQGLLRYAQDRLPAAATQISSQLSQQISAVADRVSAPATGSNWPPQRQVIAANTVEKP